MNAEELRALLESETPRLWAEINAIAVEWASPILENLEGLPSERTAFPKTFTDPILGPIELFEWEVALLDSPMLQRLRGVRQLGMAHAVCIGATHDRLSHTLGVVEVAERMIKALEKNAQFHRDYGIDRDPNIPSVEPKDWYAIRLAALLHDIGHGPFSHASETLIERARIDEFKRLKNILWEEFPASAQRTLWWQ